VDVVLIVERILHIFAGVAWVGGSALFFFYLEPTMNTLGPAAEPFINEMVERRKVPIYFLAASTLAVLGGALLYLRDSSGLQIAWITSAPGLAFTIGGLAGLLAWIGGNALIPLNLGRVSAVAAEMKAGGGPPSAELLGRMHAAQQRLRMIGAADLVLLGIALLGMATARYL
jgi:hypothetical protein